MGTVGQMRPGLGRKNCFQVSLPIPLRDSGLLRTVRNEYFSVTLKEPTAAEGSRIAERQETFCPVLRVSVSPDRYVVCRERVTKVGLLSANLSY